jgi:hypothetical protein
MKEKKETKLLRNIIELGGIEPAPDRMEFTIPCYEVQVPITESSYATIMISPEAYFDLMEFDEID